MKKKVTLTNYESDCIVGGCCRKKTQNVQHCYKIKKKLKNNASRRLHGLRFIWDSYEFLPLVKAKS